MTRTTIKTASVHNNDTLSVSPDIKAILPDVLIEYLWKLALSESWKEYEEQLFILKTGELSGQNIQDICHVCNYGDSMDTRRVYGVEPVNCTLQILNFQNGYQMQLCRDV